MPTDQTTTAILGRALRLGLGSAVLTAGNGVRLVGGADGLHAPGQTLPGEAWLDFGIGLADLAIGSLEHTLDRTRHAVAPAIGLACRPLWAWLQAVADSAEPVVAPIRERGRRRRLAAEQEAAQAAQALLPMVSEVVLDHSDVAELIGKLDLRPIIEASLAQVDFGATLDLIDLEQAMRVTAERIDLTEVALQYIDMQRVVEAATRVVDATALLRVQFENVEIADLIATPTSLAGEALRQTGRLVSGAADRGRWVRQLAATPPPISP